MHPPASIHASDCRKEHYDDRWSVDFVGGPGLPADQGFNVGMASYHVTEFGKPQVHNDQEALYVLSGVGEVLVAGKPVPARPGTVIYLPAGTSHASRRTGPEPLTVLYAHAPA